jgi:hypothetical protein
MSKFPGLPATTQGLLEWMKRITRRTGSPHLFFSQSAQANAGTGMTTLHTMKLPTGSDYQFWRGKDQFITVLCSGSFSPTVGSKTVRVNLGSNNTDFTASFPSSSFYCKVEFWRQDPSLIRSRGYLWTTSSSFPMVFTGAVWSSPGNNIGNGENVTIQAQGPGSNDIIVDYFRVLWTPSTDQY